MLQLNTKIPWKTAADLESARSGCSREHGGSRKCALIYSFFRGNVALISGNQKRTDERSGPTVLRGSLATVGDIRRLRFLSSVGSGPLTFAAGCHTVRGGDNDQKILSFNANERDTS